jgi:3-oxoacyl-[acyl-carrier-protein] synthase II
MQRQRVVITGLGVASSLGCSVKDFWHGLLAGKSGVTALPDLDLSNCRTRIGARVSGYDADSHFSARDLKRLTLTSQMALVAAAEAIAGAGLRIDNENSRAIGVVLGSATGGFVGVEPILRNYVVEKTINDPLTVPILMNSAPASNISIKYGFKGPLVTLDSACASASHSIGYAFNLIRFGMVPIVVTGGADSSICSPLIHAWSKLRALSEQNDRPTEACRPFSLDRDGIVLGEGAGILILESEQSALKRGASILAEVKGFSATSDGHHLTQPSLEGVSEAMRLALQDANLFPADIDYINAHATATRWNDKTETAGIKNVFGSESEHIPVVGIKPAIGHSIAACGALELISCVLSIREGILPPTINVKVPDPECDLDYVVEGARSCNVTHAMSNSFAFGGSNAVLIVSRYPNGTGR